MSRYGTAASGAKPPFAPRSRRSCIDQPREKHIVNGETPFGEAVFVVVAQHGVDRITIGLEFHRATSRCPSDRGSR